MKTYAIYVDTGMIFLGDRALLSSYIHIALRSVNVCPLDFHPSLPRFKVVALRSLIGLYI